MTRLDSIPRRIAWRYVRHSQPCGGAECWIVRVWLFTGRLPR